jgi:L-alanine-DL-glutamate epimerase-like enolase superfamily enzyme
MHITNLAITVHHLMPKVRDYTEVLQPDAAQKHGLIQDIQVDAQGLVQAPTGPGLGYEIDWDLIKRNKVAELS